MKDKQNMIGEILEESSYINNASPRYLFFKRLFDLSVSLLAILLFSPVFLITLVWIKIHLREAVLYTEERYGLKGRIFLALEFTKTIKNSGLRKLPLLFNILKDDMSFVGPQTSTTMDISNFKWHNLRLSVKPGITGLRQVSGKSGGVGEMVRMDLKYIRERNFRVDMKILLKAICLIFAKKESIEEG